MKIRGRFAIHFGILFLIVLLFWAPIHAQKPAADDLLVLNNVTVVDVRTGALQSEQTVILERNHIASVGPSKSAKYARNVPSVNCRGLFLIPGLWDMHVHLVFGDWFPDAQEISLPLFVANGVTGVRDMGSELDIVQDWRNEIEAGRLIGPRIYTSGPMLDGPKPRFPSSVVIATPEDAHRAVADLKQRGADFIKLQSLIPREPEHIIHRVFFAPHHQLLAAETGVRPQDDAALRPACADLPHDALHFFETPRAGILIRGPQPRTQQMIPAEHVQRQTPAWYRPQQPSG